MSDVPNDARTPYLVKNPISGEEVDLMPLFALMADGYVKTSGPLSVSHRFTEVHDFISSHVPLQQGCEVDVHRWAHINRQLVGLRNTFAQMSVDQNAGKS